MGDIMPKINWIPSTADGGGGDMLIRSTPASILFPFPVPFTVSLPSSFPLPVPLSVPFPVTVTLPVTLSFSLYRPSVNRYMAYKYHKGSISKKWHP